MSSTLEALRHWFNVSRDYHHGVLLFTVLSDDEGLKTFFRNNDSEYTRRRLIEEMEFLYSRLKKPAGKASVDAAPLTSSAALSSSKNLDLELACDQKAKQLYKQMMNDRAVLFNLTKVEGWEDVNKPELVEQRRQHALQICATNYEISQAYSDLAHVREFGRLPAAEPPAGSIEVTDVRLSAEIANLRSSITKLKGRPQTPERISLIQGHQEKLEGLLSRWNAIKQQHED